MKNETEKHSLTIGKVVKRLQEQYPDLSISKVRYLEQEGLISPKRTAGGYRLFSQEDVSRLEHILYLQKNKFLPLTVIKEKLNNEELSSIQEDASQTSSDTYLAHMSSEPYIQDKFYPIEDIPEQLNVSVSFVRQLVSVGIITLKVSPHGRDLVDGHDFALIRLADRLQHFGFQPRNLTQYVRDANRESPMFKHALSVYEQQTQKQKLEWEKAFTEIAGLTNALRIELIRRDLSQNKSTK